MPTTTRRPGPRIDPSLARSHRLTAMIRPGDADDLADLARGWNTSVSAAAWGIIATYLAETRGERFRMAEELARAHTDRQGKDYRAGSQGRPGGADPEVRPGGDE